MPTAPRLPTRLPPAKAWLPRPPQPPATARPVWATPGRLTTPDSLFVQLQHVVGVKVFNGIYRLVVQASAAAGKPTIHGLGALTSSTIALVCMGPVHPQLAQQTWSLDADFHNTKSVSQPKQGQVGLCRV